MTFVAAAAESVTVSTTGCCLCMDCGGTATNVAAEGTGKIVDLAASKKTTHRIDYSLRKADSTAISAANSQV